MEATLAATGPISLIRSIFLSGTKLTDTGANETTDCTNASLGITCPANFVTTQQLNAALKPFPFQGVTDAFGYVANSNYNALQIAGNMRASHGVTFNVNYTFSRSIDDGGTFRSGYPIPRVPLPMSRPCRGRRIASSAAFLLPINRSTLW